ncbi:MAG TPA: AMP-binding protein [Bryobacteraceae bacterium]|nr:AMP-binding protein [Bryobacteraceae bacterium]
MLTSEPTIPNLIRVGSGEATAIADHHGAGQTYDGLRVLCDRTRQLLADLGLTHQDTVAVVLGNGPETAALFVALVSCCRVAPINPGYKAGEIELLLRDLEAAALILEPGSGEAVAAAQRCAVGLIWFDREPLGGFTLRPNMPTRAPRASGTLPAADDIALLLHTSGTTARPKLVGLTHRNLWLSSKAVADTLRLTPDDRCLSIMPFFHIHGLVAGLLASLAAGATVCCPRGFQATSFFSWLSTSRATWYSAVPAMHQMILSRAPRNPEVLASHKLRLIRSSSSPLFAPVWQQLESAFNVPVLNSYGMTEAAHQIASVRLDRGCPSRTSVGMSSGPEVAVMDADGALLPLRATGEIVLRGAQVISGYLSPASANQTAFSDGWFRTGDEGFLNPEGDLTLTGRLKDIINVGGEKIAPAEIDAALMDHPAVRQAVAFGVPCSARGEQVYAAVVLGADTDARSLQRFLSERLAGFKIPEKIIILDEIPKGPTGKIQRAGMSKRLCPDDPPA